MTFRIVSTDGMVGFQPLNKTSATQKHPLGTIVSAKDDAGAGMAEFIYLKGVALTTVGDAVTYQSDDYATALLDTDFPVAGKVGIAMSDNVASQYGWYQIRGKAAGKCATAVAVDTQVYGSTAKGLFDDAVVSAARVFGACFTASTAGSGSATVDLLYPWVGNTSDAT